MNKPDPNNPYGDDKKVFVCVFDRDNDKYITRTVIVNNEDRISNKEQIVNEIRSILLDLLKNNV